VIASDRPRPTAHRVAASDSPDRQTAEQPPTRAWFRRVDTAAVGRKIGADELHGFFHVATISTRMQGNLPPEAQDKLETLQDLQETAQEVAEQKQGAETALSEAETALEALEDVDDGTQMYREVGELLIETDHDDATEQLEEKIDSLEVRVEQLGKQETKVQDKFESLQDELQEMLGGAGGPQGPAGPGGAGGA